MTKQRYDVGLLPCTASKNPTGLTPLTLYRGGPFSLMIRHARQRCKRLVIMSAKYGLLEEDSPVSWYDQYLGDLPPAERRQLLVKIRGQHNLAAASRILCYLPKDYAALLLEAHPDIESKLARPYRRLPSLRLFKVLSNELKPTAISRR